MFPESRPSPSTSIAASSESESPYEVALRIEDLTVEYGSTKAVADFSIAIESGECFALLGPSGCGKTSVLMAAAGFVDASTGQISIRDREVTHATPNRRGAGLVFQDYALFPHMTAKENIEYGLRIRRIPVATCRARSQELLALSQLEAVASHRPNEMSGGQQQRVAVARALAIEPDVLLLDEPLSNLDTNLKLRMLAEFKKLQARQEVAVLYVTHDKTEAFAIADRIGVMRGGRLVQVGSPPDLYRSPIDRFVAEFIGPANVFAGRLHKTAGRYVVAAVGSQPQLIECIPATALSRGQTVDVMVRPEDVQLAVTVYEARDGNPADEGHNVLKGRVNERTFYGSIVDYEIETQIGIIVARRLSSDVAFAAGDPIIVTLPSARTIAMPESAPEDDDE